MRSSTLRVSLAMSLSLAVSTGVLAKTFLEDFSAMPVGRCYPDGSEVGVWRSVVPPHLRRPPPCALRPVSC